MNGLLALADKFDIAMACDTDHDRHGVVTKSAGLLSPNHYLSVCVAYLFANRPGWRTDAAVGKTVVSSNVIDHAAAHVRRSVYEVPVGFKWFVDGFLAGSLGFAGEESAGSSFLRTNGQVWTTDKDGIVAALLAAGGVFAGLAIAPMLAIIGVTVLEFLVAFLQAYVFAILTCIYLNDALHLHDH